MNEIERILDQLHRSFEGPSWHGPAVMRLLKGMSPENAAKRPISEGHTIWEITLHLPVWKEFVRLALSGAPPEVDEKVDWPAVSDDSANAWHAAIQRLQASHAALVKAVKAYPEEALGEVKTKRGDWTAYQLMHGAVQHDLYHAGQIAILQKSFG